MVTVTVMKHLCAGLEQTYYLCLWYIYPHLNFSLVFPNLLKILDKFPFAFQWKLNIVSLGLCIDYYAIKYYK